MIDTGNFLSTSRYAFLITHLHHLIGGIGCYILGRSVGLKRVSAFAGALLFMFSFNNTLLSPFYWRLSATAWTPLALAGVWMICTGDNYKKGLLIGVPAIVFLVFAKSTQPLVYFAYLALFFGSAGLLKTFFKEKSLKAILKPIAFLGLLITLSVLIASPVLHAVITNAADYIRWTTEGPIVGGDGFKVSYAATQQFAYPSKGIWNILVPLNDMYSIGSTFIGATAFTAICAAWFSQKHRILVIILSIVCVYYILNGFGDAAYVSRLTYHLPLLSSVRQLTSHYIIVIVCASILTAIGFEALGSLENKQKKWLFTMVIFVIVIISAIICFRYNNQMFIGGFGVSGVVLLISPLILAITIHLKGTPRSYLLGIAAIFMILPSATLRMDKTYDVTISNAYYVLDSTKDIMAAWKKAAELSPGAYVSSSIKGGYANDKRKLSPLQVNSLALYEGLQPFFIALTPRPHNDFNQSVWVYNQAERSIVRGAEFLLTNQDISKIPTPRTLIKIDEFGELTLYRVKSPTIRGELSCLNQKQMTHLPDKNWCEPDSNSAGKISLEASNTVFKYEIDPSQKTFLKHWGVPGNNWQVSIDGNPANALPIGADRIAVAVAPGNKVVEFQYMPRAYVKTWYIFWLGIGLWIISLNMTKLFKNINFKKYSK